MRNALATILLHLHFTAISRKVASSRCSIFSNTEQSTLIVDALTAFKSTAAFLALHTFYCTVYSDNTTPSLYWPIATDFLLPVSLQKFTLLVLSLTVQVLFPCSCTQFAYNESF